MSAFELYLLLKLDNIIQASEGMSILFGICTFIVTAIYIIAGCVTGDKDAEAAHKALKWPMRALICTSTFFISLWALLPTTKQMAVIIVVPPLVEAVSNNEELKKLPDNIVSLANEWLEELKPQKEEQ